MDGQPLLQQVCACACGPITCVRHSACVPLPIHDATVVLPPHLSLPPSPVSLQPVATAQLVDPGHDLVRPSKPWKSMFCTTLKVAEAGSVKGVGDPCLRAAF